MGAWKPPTHEPGKILEVTRCFNTWGRGSPQLEKLVDLADGSLVSIHGGVEAPNEICG